MSYKKHSPETHYTAGQFVESEDGVLNVTMANPHDGSEEQLCVGRYDRDTTSYFGFKLVSLESVHAEVLAKGLRLQATGEGNFVIPELQPLPIPTPVAAAPRPRTIEEIIANSKKIDAALAKQAEEAAKREAAEREAVRASWKQCASRVTGEVVPVPSRWAATVAKHT